MSNGAEFFEKFAEDSSIPRDLVGEGRRNLRNPASLAPTSQNLERELLSRISASALASGTMEEFLRNFPKIISEWRKPR